MIRRFLLLVLALSLAAAGYLWVVEMGTIAPSAGDASTARAADAGQVERGRYLALAGNCAGCHTARGEPDYSGGRGIETPFGTIHASNLTPDPETGIGRWSREDFWRALHLGRSRDGRLLYPAFPYPDYTRVSRPDADAIFAYLQTLPAVSRQNLAHALRFPFDRQIVLAGWRALFFRPGEYREDPQRPDDWNRGAYLVQGLGHCDACHAGRNVFGATAADSGLGGGQIPMQGWYAPPLASPTKSSVAGWAESDIVASLRDGLSSQGSAMGPMAEVVHRSTQHLREPDLRAMAAYLRSLGGGATVQVAGAPSERSKEIYDDARGSRIYEEHCADCHGADGRGEPGAYPALAGNLSVTMDAPANVILSVLGGGFPAATANNPRPYGMPPFAPILSDDDIAAVVSYIRQGWGNRAAPVSARDAGRLRGTGLR